MAHPVFGSCLRWLWFFFSSRRRHTRLTGDWSSDVCSSDLELLRSIEGIEAVVDEGANARALEVREAAREVGDPAERAADLPPVELGAELRPEVPERQLAE